MESFSLYIYINKKKNLALHKSLFKNLYPIIIHLYIMQKIKICIIWCGKSRSIYANNLVRDEFLYKYELLYIIDKDFEKAKILANKMYMNLKKKIYYHYLINF